jgi:eukaryotic-like serine/threonine-protein kinase
MSEGEKTQLTSSMPIGRGTQLNGIFEIDEKIAAGGMGEVYKGHNIATGDPVAIKIVLSEWAKDERILAMFRKEASVLLHLHHPAIVRYHVFTVEPMIGRPYLAMEFLDGPSLAEKLVDGPLSIDAVKVLMARLAAGLDAAHKAGVVHRDISPDNVILARGSVNEPKIIDFGIARTTNIGGATLLGGGFAGKYNFVSPEQLGLFGGDISASSDVYSLALVIVNALRGKPIDMNGTQFEIIEKRRVIPDISDLDDTIRPAIEMMLEPDPAKRTVTMSDIAEWFTPARENSSPPTTPPTPRPKMPTTPPAALPSAPAQVEADQTIIVGKAVQPVRGKAKPAENQAVDPASVNKEASAANVGLPPQGQNADRPTPAVLPKQNVAHPAPSTEVKKSMPMALIGALVAVPLVGAGLYFGLAGGSKTPEPQTQTALTPAAPKDSKPAGGTPATPAVQEPVEDPKSKTETPPKPAADVAKADPQLTTNDAKIGWVFENTQNACVYLMPSINAGNLTSQGGLSGDPQKLSEISNALVKRVSDKVNFQPVEVLPAQCAVVNFMAALPLLKSDAGLISLASSKIVSGERLKVQIKASPQKELYVYLIGDDGTLYPLNELLRKDAGSTTISMRLTELKSKVYLPRIVFALHSDVAIKEAVLDNPVQSSAFFARLKKVVDRDKLQVKFSSSVFTLGPKP